MTKIGLAPRCNYAVNSKIWFSFHIDSPVKRIVDKRGDIVKESRQKNEKKKNQTPLTSEKCNLTKMKKVRRDQSDLCFFFLHQTFELDGLCDSFSAETCV